MAALSPGLRQQLHGAPGACLGRPASLIDLCPLPEGKRRWELSQHATNFLAPAPRASTI